MSLIKGNDLVLRYATEQSSALFVFDGFSSQVGALPKSTSHFQIETRAGSSAAVLGYIRSLGAKSSADVKPITILCTPTSLIELTAVLSAALPNVSERPPLVIQVACCEPAIQAKREDELPTLQRLPAVASLLAALPCSKISGKNNYTPVVILSGGAGQGGQEIADGLKAVEHLVGKGSDVIHAWEAVVAGQEMSSTLATTKSSEMEVEYSKQEEKRPLAESEVKSIVNTDFFSYHGPESANKVIVLPSSLHSANALAALSAAKNTGLLIARVLRPWSSEQLNAAIPTSAKEVHVLEGSFNGKAFYFDVLTAISEGTTPRRVKLLTLPADEVWTVADWNQRFVRWDSGEAKPEAPAALLPTDSKLAVFWSPDEGKTAGLADRLAAQFANENGVDTRLLNEYDNFSGKDGGLQRSTLLLSPAVADKKGVQHSLNSLVETSAPGLLFLSGPVSILSAYSPLVTIDVNTQVIFSNSTWTPEEYGEKLNAADKSTLIARSGEGKIWTLDVASVVAASGLLASDGLVEEAAFFLLYYNTLSAEEATATIAKLLTLSPAGGEWSQEAFKGLVEHTRKALKQVKMVPYEGEGQPAAAAEVDTASPESINVLPTHIIGNAIGPNKQKSFPDAAPTAPPAWHIAAKQLLFSEAYATQTDATRPDLPEENFVLTVTENRRLTPLDYDRNVFHLELSTKGTGLKYAVGEALGVHGFNDETEVKDFIEWYGLDPDAVVTLPDREHPHRKSEARTVFQIFQQNLDIFGKPGKAFYEALSKVATNREESRHLRFIGSAEGSATFKKWSDVDTVTYVDVLKAFPSTKAKLGLSGLLREVPMIKPRHYSIASSQNFVGDSVHLLVVTVDWMTPAEVTRFGQCTRYLSRLNIGDKVMVSVKPSVMKLPPRDTQPVIMAGLGTGYALVLHAAFVLNFL